MVRQLLHNTLLSAGGIIAVTILGLLIIPVIISTWGIAAFGLIALARLVLPSGIGALFDFGLCEVTTQVVARARVSNAWDEAGRRIAFLMTVSLVIGAALAVALWVSTPFLVVLFKVPSEYQQSFEFVLKLSAVSNLVLLPGLVGDGIIRGSENYVVVRGLEVIAAAAYVAGTLVSSYLSATYSSVALIYLASVVGKSICCLLFAWLVLRGWSVKLRAWSKQTRAEDARRCWLVMQGKLLGGILGPSVPFVVGALLGPYALGIYDMITRLPRFTKIVTGLLSSAVLPVASRLEQAGTDKMFQRLGQGSLTILPAVTLPPLAGVALLSGDILRHWIGPTYAAYGSWMQLMFMVPMTTQYVSLAGVIMMTRSDVQARLNRLNAWQIPLVAIVVATTLSLFEERSFIIAQVIAAVLVLPFQIRLLVRSLNLDANVYLAIATQLVVLGLAAIVFHLLTAGMQFGVIGLGVVLAVWCIAVWSIQYALVLSHEDRTTVDMLFRAALPSGI